MFTALHLLHILLIELPLRENGISISADRNSLEQERVLISLTRQSCSRCSRKLTDCRKVGAPVYRAPLRRAPYINNERLGHDGVHRRRECHEHCSRCSSSAIARKKIAKCQTSAVLASNGSVPFASSFHLHAPRSKLPAVNFVPRSNLVPTPPFI